MSCDSWPRILAEGASVQNQQHSRGSSSDFLVYTMKDYPYDWVHLARFLEATHVLNLIVSKKVQHICTDDHKSEISQPSFESDQLSSKRGMECQLRQSSIFS